MKRWMIYVAVAAVLVVGYAVYAVFFLERVAIGQLCKGSAMCPGECLGFGDLLPDYSHQEICTKACSSNADCPAPTTCRGVTVISSDGKGTETAEKQYCLPGGG